MLFVVYMGMDISIGVNHDNITVYTELSSEIDISGNLPLIQLQTKVIDLS